MPSPRKLDLSQGFLKAGVQDDKLPITSVQLDSVTEKACFQLGSRLEPGSYQMSFPFKGAIIDKLKPCTATSKSGNKIASLPDSDSLFFC